MTTEVKIPAVGESVTTGILAKWKVKSGDAVAKGQPLFDLETDKITSEGTAEVAGVITLNVAEGATVKIGEVVATIDESKAGAAPAPAKAEKKTEAAPAPKAEPKVEAPKPVAAPAEKKTSPAVERIAAEKNLDVQKIAGSGPDGRVTKADALQASGQLQGARRVKMTPLRKKIAERLVGAQHAAAMLTTFNEVDMSAVMKLRKAQGEAFMQKNGVKLGFMSFFIKAAVAALKAIPQVSAQIDGDELVYPASLDIGVAVSTERGLMVPVIRNCEKKSFAELERELGELAIKARDGKISLEALQGGCFTITNGGVFGSLVSTPILNAPQSAILGMHAIKERPIVEDGLIVARPMMYLALSYDHRVVDGKEAVTTLVTMKQVLEKPVELLGFSV